MGVSRGLLASVLAGLVAGSGCFGGTANPSYFPYLLPPGDKVETHAKPAGLGYFADFDPKARGIEVTPGTCSKAVNSDHVLIATVYDADGVPRRKRRVEWILEGPGQILEVDESGVLPGRGYREGNGRAVSYTSFRPHTFERGNRDPGDDFSIEAGQTWCIVRSAKPGETVVTAFAPEVHDHDKRTAVARVVWGGGDGTLTPRTARGGDAAGVSASLGRDSTPAPSGLAKLTLALDAPSAAGFGRELTLTLAAGNAGGVATTPLTLRLDLPGDVAFVRSEPAVTKQAGGQLSWAVGTVAPGGKGSVQLVVRPKRKGDVILVADAETGDGLTADARAVVTVGAAALELRVEANGPAEAGGPVPVTVTLTNPGAAPAEHASAWVTPPDGLESAAGGPVELAFGTVPGGAERSLKAELVARRPGTFTVPVNLTADGGIADRQTATVKVRPATLAVKPGPPVPELPPAGPPAEPNRADLVAQAKPPAPPAAPPAPRVAALTLDSLDFPATLGEGRPGEVRVTLRNQGSADAENVRVVLSVGDGLRAVGGTGADRRPADVLVGSLTFGPLDRLPPGARAVYVAQIEGGKAGAARITATVTSAGQPTPLTEEQKLRVTGR